MDEIEWAAHCPLMADPMKIRSSFGEALHYAIDVSAGGGASGQSHRQPKPTGLSVGPSRNAGTTSKTQDMRPIKRSVLLVWTA
jgi:hypothetical protein